MGLHEVDTMHKIQQLRNVYIPMLKNELTEKEIEGAILDIYDTGYIQAVNDMRKYLKEQKGD